MNKKAEKRLAPFMDLKLKNEDLKALVENLSPKDLGEIKNLLFTKILEMEEALPSLKARLERAEYSQKIIEHRMSYVQGILKQIKEKWLIFDNTFKERKKMKTKLLAKMSTQN